MLKVTNVSMGYGDSQVLFDVSLSIEENYIVSLVGSNASGKSTLISGISGTNKLWAGKIEFEGEDISQLTPKQRIERGIIQCPEGRKLFPKMTVEENLRMGSLNMRAKKDFKQNLEKVYTMFPKMKDRASQTAGLMSGGEQQMCAIGRAIMANPRLLILDEPSLGLAPIIVQQVFEMITKTNQDGMTILLVEQNVQKALSIANKGYVMESGKISMEGKGIDLLHDDNLRRSYLGI